MPRCRARSRRVLPYGVNYAAVQRVQEHFERLTKAGLARRFYQALFEAAPDLRSLFPQDTASLETHFQEVLVSVVGNLGRMTAVDVMLRDLGARHLRYGAQPQHYAIVRQALLRALSEQSAEDWSIELERDWGLAIAAIMVPMLRGAAVETANVAQKFAAEDSVTAPDA